jgi:hypothetical protein
MRREEVTDDDQVDDEDADVVDDDADLHEGAAELAERVGHQSAIRPGSRGPRVAQHDLDGVFAQNAHDNDGEDAERQPRHLHGSRQRHDPGAYDSGREVEHGTRDGRLVVIIVDVLHKILPLARQQRRPLRPLHRRVLLLSTLRRRARHRCRPCFLTKRANPETTSTFASAHEIAPRVTTTTKKANTLRVWRPDVTDAASRRNVPPSHDATIEVPKRRRSASLNRPSQQQNWKEWQPCRSHAEAVIVAARFLAKNRGQCSKFAATSGNQKLS